MHSAEFFALAAALCWSSGGLLATNPTRTLGAVTFNQVRISLVFVMLSLMALVTGGWTTLTLNSAALLTASALIGIFVGDTCYFAGMKRLGPRRSSILFTTNAPITVILGYVLLGEQLPGRTVAGCTLIMIGVFLAVFHGTTAAQRHSFEQIQGSMAAGVALSLFAACCQALSIVIARPVLASGVDAVAASALRAAIAASVLSVVWILRAPAGRPSVPLTPRLLGQVALSGFMAMALGMTFFLKALSYGCAGLVSTLSATSPVLILPVLWVTTKERPAPWAWVGAIFAVAGISCIFTS